MNLSSDVHLMQYNEINNVDDSSFFNERLRNLQNYHSYNTRFVTQNNINVPLFTRYKCQNSFLYKSIGLWNNLPSELKNCNCINKFRNNIKLYLLNQICQGWNEIVVRSEYLASEQLMCVRGAYTHTMNNAMNYYILYSIQQFIYYKVVLILLFTVYYYIL